MTATEKSNVVPEREARVAIVDFALCAAAALAIVVHCRVKSDVKYFWCDEVFTAVIMRGATLREVIASLFEPINAAPPLYFVLLWAWSQAFGDSQLSLRLFSPVFLAIGWTVVFATLRRTYGRWMAAAATSFGLLTVREVLNQNAEARCYTLYLALAFSASWLFVQSCRPGNGLAGRWLVVGSVICHFGLVATHYIGSIYSLALCGAAIVGHFLGVGRGGLRSYAFGAAGSVAAGAMSFPFYLAQRSMGGEDSWIWSPTIRNFYDALVFGGQPSHVVVLLLGAAAMISILLPEEMGKEPADSSKRPGDDDRVALAILALTFVIVPVAIWLESKVGVRLFYFKYLLPSVILWPIVVCELASRFSANVRGRRAQVTTAAICCALVLSALLEMYWDVRDPRNAKGGEIHAGAVALVRESNCVFVTRNVGVAIPIRYDEPRCRWLRFEPEQVAGSAYASTLSFSRRIGGEMEKRFWPGFAFGHEEMSKSSDTIVMRTSEFDELTRDGLLGGEWIVDRREVNFVFVRRSKPGDDVQGPAGK